MLTDKGEIRRRLNRDRAWSLYALADLDEALFGDCAWFAHGPDALALIFSGLAIRPIFVLGPVEDVRVLLEKLPVDSGYLNLPLTHLAAADGVFRFEHSHRMRRMFLHAFRPSARQDQAEPLSAAQVGEITALYGCSDGGGIAFSPQQLEAGLFRGIRHHDQLVAVAGIHVVSENEGVAGVGNIFVHPEFRGRGLAQAVTSAVVTALRARSIPSIGLNVELGNEAAYQAYLRLGFATRFEYLEGPAVRTATSSAA